MKKKRRKLDNKNKVKSRILKPKVRKFINTIKSYPLVYGMGNYISGNYDSNDNSDDLGGDGD